MSDLGWFSLNLVLDGIVAYFFHNKAKKNSVSREEFNQKTEEIKLDIEAWYPIFGMLSHEKSRILAMSLDPENTVVAQHTKEGRKIIDSADLLLPNKGVISYSQNVNDFNPNGNILITPEGICNIGDVTLNKFDKGVTIILKCANGPYNFANATSMELISDSKAKFVKSHLFLFPPAFKTKEILHFKIEKKLNYHFNIDILREFELELIPNFGVVLSLDMTLKDNSLTTDIYQGTYKLKTFSIDL